MPILPRSLRSMLFLGGFALLTAACAGAASDVHRVTKPGAPDRPTARVTPARPPAAPTGLVATADSPSQVTLAWVQAANDETGFSLEVNAAGAGFTHLGDADRGARSYTAAGLSEGGAYAFRLQARNAAGLSAYSAEATVTLGYAPPAPPAALAVTASAADTLEITWTNVPSRATGLQVERSADGATGWSPVAAVTTGTVHYQDPSLASGTRYYYRVVAAAGGVTAASEVKMAATYAGVRQAALSPGPGPGPYGADFACALLTSGAVRCWGSNAYGQVGNGFTAFANEPSAVTGLAAGITAVTVGSYHACALTTAGAVWCWGRNNYGQLGDGTNANRAAPVSVSGLTAGVLEIAAGGGHTCARLATHVACWGRNLSGQIGDHTAGTDRWAPRAVTGTAGAVRLALGLAHTCAAFPAALQCWGENDFGQLGDNTSGTDRLQPTTVLGYGASGVVDVSAGGRHTCAVTAEPAVRCWGDNAVGQLGDGSVAMHLAPLPTAPLGLVAARVTVSELHSCAYAAGGAARCWGTNTEYQLGDGSAAERRAPTAVLDPAAMSVLAAGATGGCAVRAASPTLACWGWKNSVNYGARAVNVRIY
jgi:hypothetical protein